VPAGVYNTTAIGAISIIKSNVILRGTGDLTVITSSGSNTLIEVANAEGVSIRDMAFGKATGEQIYFYNVNESEVKNCRFSNGRTNSIELNASTNNLLKKNRVFTGCIYLYDSSNKNTLTENTFIWSTTHCLNIKNSDHNLIQGNYIESPRRSYLLSLYNSSYNKIISNTFKNTAATPCRIILWRKIASITSSKGTTSKET